MDHTVTTPAGDIIFHFDLTPNGNVVGIRSDNPQVVYLIGEEGFAYNPSITVALATGIANAIVAQIPGA